MENNFCRLLAFTAAAVIFLLSMPLFTVDALQNTVTYDTVEYTMTMDIPDSINLVSSNVKKNDKLFYYGTFDYISVMAKMRDDSAAFYGRDKSNKYEFEVVTSNANYGVNNISRLSQKKLNKFLAKYELNNKTDVCNIYTSDKNTFIYTEYRGIPSLPAAYVYSYTTIFNNESISFCLISKTPVTDKSTLNILKGIADSVSLPQKQPLDFKTLPGRGSITILFLITISFFAVIIYRRHESTVNEKAGKIFASVLELIKSICSKADTHSNDDKSSHSVEPKITDNTDNTNNTGSEITNKIDEADDEDDDLSSIDLDEAIAAFDDRRTR